MTQHRRCLSSAEVTISASIIKLQILHLGQAFLPISFNYWTSTSFCERSPAEALAPRCPSRAVVQKSNLFNGSCTSASASERGKKAGLKPQPRGDPLFVWAGPGLTSGINEVRNNVAQRSNKIMVRFPRQSFLSQAYQLLFATHAPKTRRQHVRTHHCISSQFSVAFFIGKVLVTESNWDRTLASL